MIDTLELRALLLEEGLVDHAKDELGRAGLFDKGSDYDGMLGNAVLELMKSFADQGHSGMSAHLTLELFDKLARWGTLTEITDDPSEWMNVVEQYGENMGFGKSVWQSRRNPALFSNDGGKTYYSVDDEKREIVKAKAHKNG
jgi:hypothetical protein